MTPAETEALCLIGAGLATGLVALIVHVERKREERERARRVLRHEALSEIVNQQLQRLERMK